MMWDADSILRDLWNGQLRPNESVPASGDYNRVIELQDTLRGRLDPEQWKTSEELCEAIRRADLCESECAFIAGFRLGVKMMLAVFWKE